MPSEAQVCESHPHMLEELTLGQLMWTRPPTHIAVSHVCTAVLRYEVEHPVVNDSGMTLWRGLGVSSWPTLAVVSPQGKLIAMLSGEGHKQDVDDIVAAAIEVSCCSLRLVIHAEDFVVHSVLPCPGCPPCHSPPAPPHTSSTPSLPLAALWQAGLVGCHAAAAGAGAGEGPAPGRLAAALPRCVCSQVVRVL